MLTNAEKFRDTQNYHSHSLWLHVPNLLKILLQLLFLRIRISSGIFLYSYLDIWEQALLPKQRGATFEREGRTQRVKDFDKIIFLQ